MTEVNVVPKIDPGDPAAFEKLKLLDAANQEIGCKHIGEKYGRDVEAKLRAMSSAIVAPKVAAAPLTQPQRIFRRVLKAPSEVEASKPKLSPPIAPSEPTLLSAKPEAIKVAAEAPGASKLSPHAQSLLDRPLLDRRPATSSYAPGWLGEIVNYVTNSAMHPSETFATAVGLGVIGALISRRIAGPSGPQGTGTHLYQVIIGPTGSGKEHVRTTGKLLMIAANASGLIGPGRFKSGAGIIKYLQKKPVSLCFMDGLVRISPSSVIPEPQSTNVKQMKSSEIWGLSWGRYDIPQGAHDDSEAVLCPALSCLGMSTPKGALPRLQVSRCRQRLPQSMAIRRRESRSSVSQGIGRDARNWEDLRQRLAKLYQPIPLLDNTGKPSFRMSWGPGAEEVYEAIRQDVEKETDERRRELFWRSPEKTVRVATIIAAGCFDKSVNRGAMEFARQWVRKSDETLLTGVAEYMEEEKLEFSELCREIIRRVRQAGGRMKHRDVGRSFQNNLRYKRDLQSALDHSCRLPTHLHQRRYWRQTIALVPLE